jgi:hypothetical protein
MRYRPCKERRGRNPRRKRNKNVNKGFTEGKEKVWWGVIQKKEKKERQNTTLFTIVPPPP